MTERGLPIADGAPACPFVAFEDDRDERASVPDHRHRCYADARPTPRALAHQEAYCLSSAFPVCPTFQDWARREAARSRGGSAAGVAASAPSASAAMHRAASEQALETAAAEAAIVARSAMGAADADAGADGPPEGLVGGGADGDHGLDDSRDAGDDLVRRNPPRDWAAPPPWLASNEARRADDAEAPPFLGRRATPEPGQGLAGSAADRMAGGPAPARRDDGEGSWSSDSRSAAAMGAGLAAGAAAEAAAPSPRAARGPSPAEGFAEGDAVDDAEEDEIRRPARRPRAYAQHLGGPDGPDWERPRRYEAYPTIRSRVALPAVPRIALMAVAVLMFAIGLFLLPGILNIGGKSPGPGASATASGLARGSASIAPTVPPAPTPLLYTIKQNDTLSKIAKAHGITIDELLAANPTIKNPDRISLGQQIVIPTASAAPPNVVGPSSSPSAAP